MSTNEAIKRTEKKLTNSKSPVKAVKAEADAAASPSKRKRAEAAAEEGAAKKAADGASAAASAAKAKAKGKGKPAGKLPAAGKPFVTSKVDADESMSSGASASLVRAEAQATSLLDNLSSEGGRAPTDAEITQVVQYKVFVVLLLGRLG